MLKYTSLWHECSILVIKYMQPQMTIFKWRVCFQNDASPFCLFSMYTHFKNTNKMRRSVLYLLRNMLMPCSQRSLTVHVARFLYVETSSDVFPHNATIHTCTMWPKRKVPTAKKTKQKKHRSLKRHMYVIFSCCFSCCLILLCSWFLIAIRVHNLSGVGYSASSQNCST